MSRARRCLCCIFSLLITLTVLISFAIWVVIPRTPPGVYDWYHAHDCEKDRHSKSKAHENEVRRLRIQIEQLESTASAGGRTISQGYKIEIGRLWVQLRQLESAVSAGSRFSSQVETSLNTTQPAPPAWRVEHCGEKPALGADQGKEYDGEVYLVFVEGASWMRGALTTISSVRGSGTPRNIVCAVLDLSVEALATLGAVCDRIEKIQKYPPLTAEANSNIKEAPQDLQATFNSLQLWQLTKYKRILKLDCDTVVLKNIDHLFDLPMGYVAASLDPLMWWGKLRENPQKTFKYMNTGLLLFEPNMEIYNDFRTVLVAEKVPMFAGEQLLVAKYFEDQFITLPREYNVGVCCHFSWSKLSDNIKVVHFMRVTKPWKYLDEGGTPKGFHNVKLDVAAYKDFFFMWLKFGATVFKNASGIDWHLLCNIPPVYHNRSVFPNHHPIKPKEERIVFSSECGVQGGIGTDTESSGWPCVGPQRISEGAGAKFKTGNNVKGATPQGFPRGAETRQKASGATSLPRAAEDAKLKFTAGQKATGATTPQGVRARIPPRHKPGTV